MSDETVYNLIFYLKKYFIRQFTSTLDSIKLSHLCQQNEQILRILWERRTIMRMRIIQTLLIIVNNDILLLDVQ